MPIKDGPHLSAKGAERARALVELFTRCFCTPDYLVAASNKPTSFRPVETLEPLSVALNQPIDFRFSTDEVQELAATLRNSKAKRVALISWRHNAIPSLARALGVKKPPRHWAVNVYDRVWRLLISDDDEVRFADLAQGLLPGDASS
jgi:hypothetical protein